MTFTWLVNCCTNNRELFLSLARWQHLGSKHGSDRERRKPRWKRINKFLDLSLRSTNFFLCHFFSSFDLSFVCSVRSAVLLLLWPLLPCVPMRRNERAATRGKNGQIFLCCVSYQGIRSKIFSFYSFVIRWVCGNLKNIRIFTVSYGENEQKKRGRKKPEQKEAEAWEEKANN